MRKGVKKFYHDEEAKKRPKAMSLRGLQRKAEQGIITESEARVLDSMMERINQTR